MVKEAEIFFMPLTIIIIKLKLVYKDSYPLWTPIPYVFLKFWFLLSQPY